MKTRIALLYLGLAVATLCNAAPIDQYNVVWNTPSENEHGSMPIGNGDLAANVWMLPSGDLLFYISKSDAWNENSTLSKLGRIRLKTSPAFIQPGEKFTQTLNLNDGTISFSSGNKTILFWIDANRPLIHLDITSPESLTAEASLEIWRTAYREIKGPELKNGVRALVSRDGPSNYTVAVDPDTIMPPGKNSITWYHRNTRSCFPATLKAQHLEPLLDKISDPLINRTFGAVMQANNMQPKNKTTLAGKSPAKKFSITITALTAQTATPQQWLEKLNRAQHKALAVQRPNALQDHRAWWHAFWQRSHILLTGTPDAQAVGRAYNLQRWITASAGRGAYPIKFNGSLFTVGDVHDRGAGPLNADYRRWGACYWFQNTRLIYWPMLNSGDFDMMHPLWKMYRDSLPLMQARTHIYFHHDGIFCPETMYFWGTYANNDFGWHNKGNYPVNSYIRYYWDSGIELSLMMIEYFKYTGNRKFVTNTLLPIASEVITFYDQHYQRDANGKIRFNPAMSLETWHKAVNPLPLVVGLKTVINALIALPTNLTTPDQRKQWQRVLTELPDIPLATESGKTWIKPAQQYAKKANCENPELYAVFPYRAYTKYKPNLDVALETWKRRRVKRTGGWTQDSIQAAMLGLTEQAKNYVVKNATTKDTNSRFPAFWGPNFDWTPDQDHGSVLMIALQTMLMQCQGNKIYLLPAWPKDWNAEFKLHAPGNTTIQGRVENGKVLDLKVNPPERRKDIVHFVTSDE